MATAVVLLSLSSCGTPVCIIGVGDCSVYDKSPSTLPTPTTNSLSLTISSSTILIGQTAVLTVSGGTSPFTYSMVSGGGSVTTSGTQGTYTAPSFATTATVRVTDSAGNTKDQVITVNAS